MNSNLETINIPNTITEIKSYAFYKSGIKTFTFPEKITAEEEYNKKLDEIQLEYARRISKEHSLQIKVQDQMSSK